MSPLPIASIIVLGSFATLLLGTILYLHRRHDPLRRLASFRVPTAQGIRFERLDYATIGDTPTARAWFRHTLSYALDSDYIYLRHSRLIPFFPSFWRLPRKQVQPHKHDCWSICIHAADPPLNADFGSDFVKALRERSS